MSISGKGSSCDEETHIYTCHYDLCDNNFFVFVVQFHPVNKYVLLSYHIIYALNV